MITLLTVLVLFVAVPLFIGCLSLVDDPIPDMKRILDCGDDPIFSFLDEVDALLSRYPVPR
jgi:hypothetical protein